MNAYKEFRSVEALYGAAIALYWKSSEMQNSTPDSFETSLSKGRLAVPKRMTFWNSTPPASKSPAPIMDLGAQNKQTNLKSEGLQWDLRILELDLRFRGGLGLSPIGLENFRGGLSPSPPLNLKSNSKILKSNWT